LTPGPKSLAILHKMIDALNMNIYQQVSQGAGRSRRQPQRHTTAARRVQRMAKQQKIKYTVTTTVIDTVPVDGKPLKLKDVKAAVDVGLMDGTPDQLVVGKVKVEAAAE